MNDDPRVRDILDQAAELPVDKRAAYLDVACGGNVELRGEVDSLLLALDQADEFLDKPTITAPPMPAKISQDQIGSSIGPYQLIERLGEGGMGVVFLAEQGKPVRRQVALKIIKPGMDSTAIIARFEAERQALALMDHSNIARVYDAGTTSEGRPYFVMELVRGMPITRYCDDNLLPPEQRLELFISVCQAVQHAHQKGIIHRDLKPGNILVTVQDGKPVAKVIDFGIAKALNQTLTEKTVFTQVGMIVGTPEYMSPEQAGANPEGTDTRSDVYALGVILYELLTGNTPLDRAQLRQAGYEQMMRVIREVDPPRPSTRLSTIGEGTATASALRRMEPRKLARLLSGDLDCIVMKCLEKDRSRRYETVSGLARDIERYFQGEPITARPASAWYQATKFARRNRVLVTGIAAVVLALLLGIVGTSLEMVRARRAEAAADVALTHEAEQRKRAETALDREAEQRQRAETRFNDVRNLSTQFMFKFDDALATVSGATRVRRMIMTTAQQYLDSLNRDAGADGILLRELATSYKKLGDILGNPHMSNLGDTAGAMVVYQKALAILEPLVQQNPPNGIMRADLSGTYVRIGDLQRVAGQSADALVNFQKALDLNLTNMNDSPPYAYADRDLLLTYQRIGNMQSANAQYADALRSYGKALDICVKLAHDHPNSVAAQLDLANGYSKIGDIYGLEGKTEEALASYGRSLEILRGQNQTDPTNAVVQRDLALAYADVGDLEAKNGQVAAALNYYQQGLAIVTKLTAEGTDNAQVQHDLANCYDRIGSMQLASGAAGDALASFSKALDIWIRLAGDPANAQAQRGLSISYEQVGNARVAMGDTGGALLDYDRAREIRMRLLRDHPDNLRGESDLAIVHREIAMAKSQAAQQETAPIADRLADLRAAAEEFQLAKDFYLKLQAAGKATPTDLNQISIITGMEDKAKQKEKELQRTSATQPAMGPARRK